MNKKLAVCVPYRDRKTHLEIFVPYLTAFLSGRGIEHKIFICHQTDSKPFNRGKMKNIAFDIARKEGYDYFAFHDIDLLPEDDSCDYSYPAHFPVHLAVYQSKDDYRLLYPRYFGGCVMFTREQFEKVNGYSNNYWGWGWEDDDLFFRSIRKGWADIQYLPVNWKEKNVACIMGKKSYIQSCRCIGNKNLDKNGFSLMVLTRPEVDNEEYLVGDKYSYFETPIFSAGKYNIINYSKYESFVAQLVNRRNFYYSLGDKGAKNDWSLLFLTVDVRNKLIRFFINGREASLSDIQSPITYRSRLKSIAGYPVIIGRNFFSFPDIFYKKHFTGKIAEICLWDVVFTEEEIQKQIHNISEKAYNNKLVLWYDFEETDLLVKDKSGNNNHGRLFNCQMAKEAIKKITKYCNPHRREGRFQCLPHKKESFKQHFLTRISKQSKSAFTNERIFKLQVQTGKIDCDTEGISNLSYKLIDKEIIFGKHVMLNVQC